MTTLDTPLEAFLHAFRSRRPDTQRYHNLWSIADESLREFFFGTVRKPHKLWAVGDRVMALCWNGQGERYYTYGFSSKKGCFLGGCYVQWWRHVSHGPPVRRVLRRDGDKVKRALAWERFASRRAQKYGPTWMKAGPWPGVVEEIDYTYFEWPSQLVERQLGSLADSDARLVIEALRVAYSASR